MYFGFIEVDLLSVIARELQPGDTAIDVSANIGMISAHMAGAVGITGYVHSLEPSARVFGRLKTFAALANRSGYNIRTEKQAVWDAPGTANMTYSNNNIGWICSVDGFMNPLSVVNEESVPRIRLDEYIEQHVENIPKVIKIDVEGAEYFVLQGLSQFFDEGHRPVIICEVAPSAFQHFGKLPEDIFTYMGTYGYTASAINGQKVTSDDLTATTNVVWRAS